MTNTEQQARELTPEYLAMTPLQKWETLALHGLLGTDEPWIEDMRKTLAALERQHNPDLEGLVERLWQALLERCAADPRKAKRLVMVGRDDIAEALSTIQPPAIEDERTDLVSRLLADNNPLCVEAANALSLCAAEIATLVHERGDHAYTTPSPHVVEALKELERDATAALAAMDSHNEKYGMHLGGPSLFKLGRSVAKARAALSSGEGSGDD